MRSPSLMGSSKDLLNRKPPPIPPKPKLPIVMSRDSFDTVKCLKAVRPAPPPPFQRRARGSCDFSCISAPLSNVLSPRRPSAPGELQCTATSGGAVLGEPGESSKANDLCPKFVSPLLPGHESFVSEISSGLYSDSESSDSDESNAKEIQATNVYRVAQEMCKTEWAYVNTLKALCIDFPAYIEHLARKGQKVIAHPDIAVELSRHLDALRLLHEEIAEQLQARLQCWTNEGRLSDIVLQLGHFLKMSRMFLQQKSELVALITNACRQYPELAAAVKSFELDRFNGLQLINQLDCVHQRICRYPLLLTSYIKYLAPDSVEYPLALEARALLQKVAREIEDGLVEGDNMRRMYQIQRRLQNDYEIIKPGRKLIKEGEILKHSRKEIQSRYLLLFNDVLLYCAPVVSGGDLLKIRNELPLSTLDLPELPNNDATCVEFHLRSQRRSVILLTKSTEERDDWMEAISSAVGTYQKEGLCAHDYEDSQCRVKDVGRKAPPWVPDDRVTMCQHCSSQFNPVRRRHHCRGCGKVMCRRCSGKAPLEYADFTVQLVCPDCYEILIDRVQDELSSLSANNSGDTWRIASFLPPRFERKANTSLTVIPNDPRVGAFKVFQYRCEEDLLKQGYLFLQQNRRAWKKYWCLLRKDALFELYAASEDKVAKFKFVLLSYAVEKVLGIDGQPDAIDVTHKNQVVTSGSHVLRLVLRASNNQLTHSWYEAIRSALLDFEEE